MGVLSMVSKEKAISVPRAAELLGMTRSAVNYWIKTKKTAFQTVGEELLRTAKGIVSFS